MLDAKAAIDRFTTSTRIFLNAFDDAPQDAWHVRPADDTWSLAETVEHVVLTDRAIRATMKQLLTTPFPAGAPRLDDLAISPAMFETAGPPPAGLAEPTGRFTTPAEGVAALVEIRDAIVASVLGASVDLRAHGSRHPVFGFLDGVQWTLFAAAHTDSHRPQLLALRARE